MKRFLRSTPILKKKHFKKLRILLWLTGLSIMLSLLVVFVNGFDTGSLLPVFAVLVALLNGYTVLSAVLLVIDMVDPKNVEKTADKLIQESSGEYKGGSPTQTLPVAVFIQKFDELEQLAEKLLKRKNATNRPHLTGYSSFSTLIKELEQLRILSRFDLQMLNRVFRMRNLLAHGMTKSVSLKDFTELEMLINIFKNLLDN